MVHRWMVILLAGWVASAAAQAQEMASPAAQTQRAAATTAQTQGVASARVVAVDTLAVRPVVQVDVGRAAGLGPGAQVTVLRELEPIVHPLTGAVLGVPQEPVGVGRVIELEGAQARAQLIRVYSPPRVGDVAEFVIVVGAPRTGSAPPVGAAPGAAVPAERLQVRLQALEEQMVASQQRQQRTATYPTFAREVHDELLSLRGYLVSMDERLVQLEMRQGQAQDILSSVMQGEYRATDTRQFTIRYDADTQVQVRVAGKTLIVDVTADSLQLEELVAAQDEDAAATRAGSAAGGDGSGFDWSVLASPPVQAVSLVLIAVLGGALYLLMRRREQDALADLEDLDADFLGADDEELPGR